MEQLVAYEQWGEPTQIDFEKIVDPEKWQLHWDYCNKIQSTMQNAQELATEIKEEVAIAFKRT